MIKNIIFDLAGVILNLNLERDTKELHNIGLPDFAACVKNPGIMNAIIPYLNGLCTPEELLKAARPFCRPDVTDEEIFWAMDAVLDDIPVERLQMLVELRKKYKVFLLSNLYEKAWNHTLKQFEKGGFTPEQCFDKIFLSYEMQLAKPDPRIYKQVFEETGINPDETAYFDDSRENIEAGNTLGMHSFLVPPPTQEEESQGNDWLVEFVKSNINSFPFRGAVGGLFISHYISPIGPLTLASDGENLIGLWFDRQKYDKSTIQEGVYEENDSIPVLQDTRRWLDIYFAGQIPDFTPKLKVEGSEFKKLVAEAMLNIPYGETTTYGKIGKKVAQRMGKATMSAQAVGGAVGHNAIGIIIPCHRVIGSDGSLTGYAGGLDKKVYLLELERKK